MSCLKSLRGRQQNTAFITLIYYNAGHLALLTAAQLECLNTSEAAVTLKNHQQATNFTSSRTSPRDRYLLSLSYLLKISPSGVIPSPCLPPYTMPTTRSSAVPATPRVISPSPTPSELQDANGYFAPVTRSARKRMNTSPTIDENHSENSDESAELGRARSRSRSPAKARKTNGIAPLKPITNKSSPADTNGKLSPNIHLSPSAASPRGWSWRDISRSPSPLGIIPIHRHWRSFVHKHEVPRKVLHVSIGFFTLSLYRSGLQPSSITPYLMTALIPIATVDYLRHAYPALNRFYVRYLGAFMRETEYEGWNGVIWYLLGAWLVLGFFPKDVGVMGVLLLSWCDTAASTVGRAWGRYTPR